MASVRVCAQTPVVGVEDFSHIVTNVERSVAFYRDVLDLEMPNPPRRRNRTKAAQTGCEVSVFLS
jgi:hypothetical protein